MSQLDLNVSEAQKTILNKMITPHMRDRLKDEEADLIKVVRRDHSYALLAGTVYRVRERAFFLIISRTLYTFSSFFFFFNFH